MNASLKSKIRKQIQKREVLAFSGYKVRILEILEDGKVRVQKLKRSKNAFSKISVDYTRLEKIVENPYVQKDPVSFLKRNGFKAECSDEGFPLMSKKIDGFRVIIGYCSPATQKDQYISLSVETKSGGSLGTHPDTKDFKEVFTRIPEMISLAKK